MVSTLLSMAQVPAEMRPGARVQEVLAATGADGTGAPALGLAGTVVSIDEPKFAGRQPMESCTLLLDNGRLQREVSFNNRKK